MNAPAKTLLKIASILYIVFGGITAIGSFLLLSEALMAGSSEYFFLYTADFVLCAAQLLIGIYGLGRCADIKKANFFIISGAVFFVFRAGSVAIGILYGGFSWANLIGFALPALFVAGGVMNRKAQRAQAAAAVAPPGGRD